MRSSPWCILSYIPCCIWRAICAITELPDTNAIASQSTYTVVAQTPSRSAVTIYRAPSPIDSLPRPIGASSAGTLSTSTGVTIPTSKWIVCTDYNVQGALAAITSCVEFGHTCALATCRYFRWPVLTVSTGTIAVVK
jgi:hypothetical protein